MAGRGRKQRRNFSDIVHVAPERERKRSLEVPLLWLGAAAFIGLPLIRDATSDRMLRNQYGSDRYSCECDYGEGRCDYRDNQWVGPWYARDGAKRKADDLGSGTCHARGHGGSYYYGGGARPADDAYRPPVGVERGYRGGFGGTGRVRSARS